MKIAQVAPLYESVPPKLYGGTERIVAWLTEELIQLGHEVTLFASADSATSAQLVPCATTALRLNKQSVDTLAPHIVELQEVMERADEFDIIHFHTDYIHFPTTRFLQTPHVTTLHGSLDIPELQDVYSKFKSPVISISDSQRKPLPQANFISTVLHGMPPDVLKAGAGKGEYLAFLGRTSPEKGLETAIEWAVAANMRLKIAAKVDKADRAYFKSSVKPLLEHPLIEFAGEISDKQKQQFLGDAKALLFPISWNEPFGIVMIEAMACGTPVIAHKMGSVPEIIENGNNGFIVSSTEEAVGVISQLNAVDRQGIRKSFEEKFLALRMANDYVAIYKILIGENTLTPTAGNKRHTVMKF